VSGRQVAVALVAARRSIAYCLFLFLIFGFWSKIKREEKIKAVEIKAKSPTI
jgi:hypothetical protein